jgi:hypothetical protein
MRSRARKLAATTAAALALGGLTGGTSLGLAAAKSPKATSTHSIGQKCTKVGATSKTKKGVKIVCTKKHKLLKWEAVKAHAKKKK